MDTQYHTFQSHLEEQFGKDILLKYRLYSRLRNKLSQNNLTTDEANSFCDTLFKLLQELAPEHVNELGVVGFAELLMHQYRLTSFRDLYDNLQQNDGYERLKAELAAIVNPYELLYVAIKEVFGLEYISGMPSYIEMHKVLQFAELSAAEIEQLMFKIAEASKIMDTGIGTEMELAYYFRLMRISPAELLDKLSSPAKLAKLKEDICEKMPRVMEINKVFHRVQGKILEKYTNINAFVNEFGISRGSLQALSMGRTPRISRFIEIAYATNTTLEYLFNGKLESVGLRNSMDEVIADGRYITKIFVNRLKEFSKVSHTPINELLEECGINPMTLSQSWEVQGREPDTEIVLRICRKKELNIDYMLGLTNKRDESYFVMPVKLD